MKLLNYLDYNKISADNEYVKKVFDDYYDEVITIQIESSKYREIKILDLCTYRSSATNKPDMSHLLFKLDKITNLKLLNSTIVDNYLLFYPDYIVLSDTNGQELNRSNAVWTRKSITNNVVDWTTILIEYFGQFELLDKNRKVNLAMGTVINDNELITLSISSQLIDEIIYIYISNLELCKFKDVDIKNINPRNCKVSTGWIYGPNITDYITSSSNSMKVYNIATLIGNFNSLIYKASQMCRIFSMHGDNKMLITKDIQSNYSGINISSRDEFIQYLDNENLWRM